MSAHHAPADQPTGTRQVAESVPARPMTVGSLFSGIGGIDLGLERAGMQVIWQSEIEPYAARILAKHWPDVPNLGDITKIEWSEVERPDVVAGGFPCQPVSVAGRRRGQDDERWLWPEFARCLRHLRPRYAVMENVPGLLVRGMGDVLGDLASLGYDAGWQGVPAAAVGAPHLRWRIFIVARAQYGRDVADASSGWRPGDDVRPGRDAARGGGASLADTDGERLEERRLPAEGREHLPHAAGSSRIGQGPVEDAADRRGQRGRPASRPAEGWRPFRVSPRSSSSHGWWESEPELGRVANGIPDRVDRLRCLGNAVVPQVAEYVGRQLVAAAAQFDGSACTTDPHTTTKGPA